MDNLSFDDADSPARGRQARLTKASQKLSKRQLAFKSKCTNMSVRRRATAPNFSTVWRVRPQIPGLEFIAIDTWMALGKWYSKACNALARKHGCKVRVAYDRDSDSARQTGDALVVTLYGNAASMSPVVVQEMQSTLSNLVFPVQSPFAARIDRATVIKDRGLVEVVVEVTTEVRSEGGIRKQYVLPEIMRMFSKNLPAYLKRVHAGHWDLRSILPSPLPSESSHIYITFKIAKQISEAQMKLEIDNLDTMLNLDCGVPVPIRVQAVVQQEGTKGAPMAMPLGMPPVLPAVPVAEVVSRPRSPPRSLTSAPIVSPRPYNEDVEWPLPLDSGFQTAQSALSDSGFQTATERETGQGRPSLAEAMARFQNNFGFGV